MQKADTKSLRFLLHDDMNSRAINITRIVILFLLLLIPAFYAVFTAIDMEYSWLKKAAYMVVVIALLLLPALVFKAKTYFILEGIFNFFFFPIDIASLYLNRQSTSVPFLENILHTDLHEATELLASIWPLGCRTRICFIAARVSGYSLVSPSWSFAVYAYYGVTNEESIPLGPTELRSWT